MNKSGMKIEVSEHEEETAERVAAFDGAKTSA